MTDDDRPDPDRLLAAARADARANGPRRGALKVWIGAAAGVGKTCSMLDTAREQRAAGRDVVIGLIEHHGRAETLHRLEGLEVIPRRSSPPGHPPELDVDAVIARRPEVVVVDELAHTNAPGSRHPKRWQDVLELRDAGLEVWTAVNVQHLERTRDVVERLTGVSVQETVPDAVLDDADDIELVDLPPDALLQRLRDGKVYAPDAARRALGGFFRKGNLLGLRELALRRAAMRVGEQVDDFRDAAAMPEVWTASERVLVAVGPSPSSERVVRVAARLAASYDAEWHAVAVGDQPGVAANLGLAERLGAEVATIEGDDVAAALIGYARAHNLTTVVLGASPPRWLRPSLVDAVTRAARDLTVHVVPPRGPSPRPQPEPSQTGRTARDLAVGVLVVAAATGVAWLGRDVLPETDLLMIYLGALVVAAFRLPRGVSFATALLAVSAFNFFFTEPRFTLYVDERRYLLTFTVLGGIGFLVSHLAARVRERAAAAARREREARALYRLGRDLAGADDVVAVATVAVEHLGRWLDGDVVVLLPDGDHLERVAGAAAPTDDERAVARYAFEHAAPSGRGTDTLPSAATTWLPIGQGGRVYGVVGLRGARGLAERRTLVDAILDHVGLSLAREAFAARSAAATREVDAERTRTSLLASVSHDLRTPLAAITGAATTLLDSPVDAAARGRLLGEIVDESLRLERLLQNLLQMTRLQEGASPDFDWCVAQEIVATAVERVRREAGPRVIRVEAPDDPVWTRCDALLVEQATVNLLENALRHAPGATPIDVRVVSGDPVRIEVLDRGPGVEPERAERVFDRFERGPRSTGGAGLGLAIVRAVARVHGGDATVSRRDGGGAAFALTLPGGAPEVPP